MKKRMVLIVLLMLSMIFSGIVKEPVSVYAGGAADEEGLYIGYGGKHYYYTNTTGWFDTAGHAGYFDAEEKTLTLTEFTGEYIIWRNDSPLKIILKGKNVIDSEIYSLGRGGLVITGDGSLSTGGIESFSKLTIMDTTMSISGDNYGLFAYDSLTIDNSDVNIKAKAITQGLYIHSPNWNTDYENIESKEDIKRYSVNGRISGYYNYELYHGELFEYGKHGMSVAQIYGCGIFNNDDKGKINIKNSNVNIIVNNGEKNKKKKPGLTGILGTNVAIDNSNISIKMSDAGVAVATDTDRTKGDMYGNRDDKSNGSLSLKNARITTSNMAIHTLKSPTNFTDYFIGKGKASTIKNKNWTGVPQSNYTTDLTIRANNPKMVHSTVNSNGELKSAALKRLYGKGRYDTMKAIVDEGFKATGGTVIVATGEDYKDALSACGLAGAMYASIVLTNGKTLSPQAETVLKRLKPRNIYVAGGPMAISDKVIGQIKTATKVTPKRIAGASGSDTSAKLALAGKGRYKDGIAIIATNKSFKDALSVAPIAYTKKYPILLANNGTKLDQTVLDALKSLGIKEVIIVGGRVAVTTNVESQLKKQGIRIKKRLAGATAVDTSAVIARWGLSNGMSPNKMGFATSQNFPDALAAAAVCGNNKSVLLLVDDKNMLNASFPKTYKNRITRAYVFGGTNAVGTKTWNELSKSIN